MSSCCATSRVYPAISAQDEADGLPTARFQAWRLYTEVSDARTLKALKRLGRQLGS
jgi:hypothetical protein